MINPTFYKVGILTPLMKEAILNYRGQGINQVKLSKKNNEMIEEFLNDCKITASDNSIVKIRNKIILIADSFEKDLNKLTLNDVKGFLIILNKSDKAIATKNDIKKVLKRFIKSNYKDWSEKFENFDKVKVDTKHEGRKLDKSDLLTPDEMKIIISSIESLKYKTILLLMQETANRPEELLKLTWGDINFNSNEIKLNSAKTGETRTIPINESTAHLNRYKQECFFETPRNNEFIFPNPRDNSRHLTNQALADVLMKLERKLKFQKHLYPYLWRHSILSNMIKKLSPKVYEMYAGHSLETGMKTYAHLDTDDLKDELYKKVYEIEELTSQEKDKMEKLSKELGLLKKQVSEEKVGRNTLQKQILEEKYAREKIQEAINEITRQKKEQQKRKLEFFDMIGEEDNPELIQEAWRIVQANHPKAKL